MPFEPKGEIAQWRVVYRVFESTAVESVVTYAELAEVLDLDANTDRHRIQAAARRAGKHLLTTQDRAVETVPEVGYKVVVAARQIAMAGNQIERASHALDHGHALTTHIKMDELTEAERAIVQTMAVGFSQVINYAKQIGRRVEDHEGRLADVEAELKRLREERNKD